MQELIKPNSTEVSKPVHEYDECGKHCDTPNTCNKYCSAGANNTNIQDEADILF